ncbi:MAG: cobalamin-dependent protein [Candidatus Cloacimonetes bacterium]|nr:cobalamin-dependent protein [Candidatus Cloacimonadota bacterium]
MERLLFDLSIAIERGKENETSPYPPDLKGKPGAYEFTSRLLEMNCPPDTILKQGMMPGMDRIGKKFADGIVFIPEILIAAKAMKAAMTLLKPYFDNGAVLRKGKVIIGTVAGDLHDIGKNIVCMVLEGAGWEVFDLGVDVTKEKFLASLNEHPESIICMSALLTTTMREMEKSVTTIKQAFPQTKIYLGGAPLTSDFADKIGADGYFPDPHSLSKHLTGNL